MWAIVFFIFYLVSLQLLKNHFYLIHPEQGFFVMKKHMAIISVVSGMSAEKLEVNVWLIEMSDFYNEWPMINEWFI